MSEAAAHGRAGSIQLGSASAPTIA